MTREVMNQHGYSFGEATDGKDKLDACQGQTCLPVFRGLPETRASFRLPA